MHDQTPAHLGGHFGITNTDQHVLDYLVARYAISTMLDVGCGPGGMLDMARLRGIEALGIDGDPSLPGRADVIRHDYTTGPLVVSFHRKAGWHVATPDAPSAYAPIASARATIDLGWCVEFVEHVAADFIEHYLATLRCCRVVLISHALPGQGGHHHVNEQPATYWRRVLQRDGWHEIVPCTEWVQANALNQYVRSTGMVWMR